MIWLVRHAQPLIASGVCYGALDVAADREATRIAAEALANDLPPEAKVVVSPLQRCELLAHVLYGLRPDLIHKTDARLAEMNFGVFEGQRWDSISLQAYEAWTSDFWRHRFGGSESVAEFMARVGQAWDDTGPATADQRPLVWITHAGVIRAASLISMGVREVHEAAGWPAGAPAFGQAWCVPCRLAKN